MQIIKYVDNRMISSFCLPSPNEEILPGVKWGRADEVFSSAFWSTIAKGRTKNENVFRLGSTLREEIAACLLGGFGIPAEFGLAAFDRLKSNGILNCGAASEEDILRELLAPLVTRLGASGRYRFARQKAKYLAQALRILETEDPPEHSGRLLRGWLMKLPGVGWKTASWISRNWLGAEDVAILDIHIMRAGYLAGIFPKLSWSNSEYLATEEVFLAWSGALGVSPAHLDSLIWSEMRSCNGFMIEQVKRCVPPAMQCQPL